MSNKTFIPAFQCSVGDWKYYICMMKYGEVGRQVQFAHELSSNQELGQLIQRGISARTKGITEYLLNSAHRFLGGLVVAAWGGEPQYTPLSMEDPEGMLRGLDREFGVLTFDGTQAYFVLDGQHRLRSIKDAMKKNPDLGKEDICVLIVTHYDTVDGRMRTRRLFSNINKNAKQTGQAENIALDEDDGFAILTRRFLDEHEFLKQEGRVKVITYAGEEGELKLAKGSVPKGDSKALTTFTVLYDILRYIGFDLAGAMRVPATRPSDDVLDASYETLNARLDDLLTYCGNIRDRLEAAASARDVRAPKNAEGEGHPFMRPVVQKAVARVSGDIVQQGLLTWPETMERLSTLSWRLAATPFEAVYSIDGAKMLTGKENTELLCELLHVHLAPASMQAIKRARKSFRDIRSKQYPVPEDDLAKRLPSGDTPQAVAPIEHPAEVSEETEQPATEHDDTEEVEASTEATSSTSASTE
jgi:DNA sulfur modification protein DndB